MALTAAIDDYSTEGEIGVKMTSATGNLAGHPFTLVRLFKSTDYACSSYGSVDCGKAASPPPFFKTQRVSPGCPSERRVPYPLLFSKGFGVPHIIPAPFPTGRIRPVFRPLILCSARILRSCRPSSEPRPIGLIHLVSTGRAEKAVFGGCGNTPCARGLEHPGVRTARPMADFPLWSESGFPYPPDSRGPPSVGHRRQGRGRRPTAASATRQRTGSES